MISRRWSGLERPPAALALLRSRCGRRRDEGAQEALFTHRRPTSRPARPKRGFFPLRWAAICGAAFLPPSTEMQAHRTGPGRHRPQCPTLSGKPLPAVARDLHTCATVRHDAPRRPGAPGGPFEPLEALSQRVLGEHPDRLRTDRRTWEPLSEQSSQHNFLAKRPLVCRRGGRLCVGIGNKLTNRTIARAEREPSVYPPAFQGRSAGGTCSGSCPPPCLLNSPMAAPTLIHPRNPVCLVGVATCPEGRWPLPGRGGLLQRHRATSLGPLNDSQHCLRLVQATGVASRNGRGRKIQEYHTTPLGDGLSVEEDDFPPAFRSPASHALDRQKGIDPSQGRRSYSTVSQSANRPIGDRRSPHHARRGGAATGLKSVLAASISTPSAPGEQLSRCSTIPGWRRNDDRLRDLPGPVDGGPAQSSEHRRHTSFSMGEPAEDIGAGA